MKDRPAERIDYEDLARRTGNFSGADLLHLCESATELAMEIALDTGSTKPIVMDDFNRAFDNLKPSTLPWFETARNYATYANEGGMYDDLLAYIRDKKI